MNYQRTTDQPIRSGNPGSDRDHAPDSEADGFLLLAVLLVLLAAGTFAAIGMPQALEIAACHANASMAIFRSSNPTQPEDRALEVVEEESAPLIVDDLRTDGLMNASADVPDSRVGVDAS